MSAVEKVDKKALMSQPLKSAANVQTLLDAYQDSFARVAPKTLDVQRMLRIAVMVASRNPKLRDATGMSLLGALMTASQMGLDIGMGLAHLVPFKNQTQSGSYQTEVQLIPDYKGLIELVTNTGRITAIRAVPVFIDDVKDGNFIYEEGAEPKLIHRPQSRSMNPEDLYAVYSVARYHDGFLDIELMFRNEIEMIRDRARAKKGPWQTDYIEMAKKTVIKRHCKRLPKSLELVTAISLDDAAAMGVPQRIQVSDTADGTVVDVDPEYGDEPEQEKQPNTGKLSLSQAKPVEESEIDPQNIPEKPDEPSYVGVAKQLRLIETAKEVGWKTEELLRWLEKHGIPDIKQIPADRYDNLTMAVLGGGDLEEPKKAENEPSEDEDDSVLASDQDWAAIRGAAKATGLSDKDVTAIVKGMGIKLNSRLPKNKVASLLQKVLEGANK